MDNQERFVNTFTGIRLHSVTKNNVTTFFVNGVPVEMWGYENVNGNESILIKSSSKIDESTIPRAVDTIK